MSKAKILVVEDNALNAKLLRDALGFNDYEVIEAGTAEAGLELAVSASPDLILMDIHLPGMDGMQALKILKADAKTAKIPVIAVTASIMPVESEQIIAAGFDGFQGKPISILDMLSEVKRFLPEEG